MFENIKANKFNIIKDLQDELFSGFSFETQEHLNNPDPFLNPVGSSVRIMLETVFDQVTGEMDNNKIFSSLDDYCKIMALQELRPSRALGFLLSLRRLINNGTGSGAEQKISPGEINMLEDRINDILLRSFDIYMECRENIFIIRVNELKKRTFRVPGNLQ